MLLLASSLRAHTWPTYSNIFSTSLPQILIYCIHWAWSENCEEKRTAFIHISMFDSLNYECSVAQLCLTLCDPIDCSLPDSSVHSILQARIMEWVAIPFSWISSRPRDQTQIFCIAGGFFNPTPPHWTIFPYIYNEGTIHFPHWTITWPHSLILLKPVHSPSLPYTLWVRCMHAC